MIKINKKHKSLSERMAEDEDLKVSIVMTSKKDIHHKGLEKTAMAKGGRDGL